MLPFAGIATFFRAEAHSLDAEWHADAALLGVPFDITVGYRPGARFAPRAIREASLRYALPPEGYYHPRHGYRLTDYHVVDAGDVDLPTLEPMLAFDRITAAARALRQRATLPIFIGGDHSVSFPLLRAFDDVDDLHIVQIDAHLDFTDIRNETRYSNSSPFRRAVEVLPNLRHITTIGLRGVRFDREAVDAAIKRGHRLVFREDLFDADIETFLPEGKPVYLSFDVDALDPSVFPATSSPEADGLSFREVVSIIQATAARNFLVGVDVVEMTPSLDVNGNSALLAARLLVEIMLAAAASHHTARGDTS